MLNTTNTTTPAFTTIPDAKKAEYARLYNLFESLASHRSRQDASFLGGLPTSQLDPLLKKLSAIVDTNKTSSKRPRRNTVASIIRGGGERNIKGKTTTTTTGAGSDSDMLRVEKEIRAARSDEEDEIESLAKFPLADAKKYPFTFRWMVHKLYNKDEWAKTIKEMLEKSKTEFKPLAEQQAAAASTATNRDGSMPPTEEGQNEQSQGEDVGAIRFKVPTTPVAAGGGRRSGRQRSQSVAGTAIHKAVSPTSPTGVPLRSPGSSAENAQQADIRALKKRCVGRRKSMSGPMNIEVGAPSAGSSSAGKSRGTWVYDAAISSAEHPVAMTFNTFPPSPPPSPTLGRYKPLGAVKVPSKMQDATWSGGGGMKRRVNAGEEVPLLMPLQQVTNANIRGLAARRRVTRSGKMNKMEDDSEEPRKTVKRPFAG
ncbi:hypothetical protein CPB84DRAFT_773639 [Gymnopilus junonius]|uniref:Uncharacterized protein n=1 Tax=Gymnopilus junonius TaxID=109634 RepID=A0A9P5NNT8_GYMJU|nr:hypothetical protein CPB84DRAFT_773639 [Gymnopilus junonius]